MKKLFLILITLSNYLIAQQTGTLINPAAINGYTTNGKVLMTKTSGSITGVPSWTNTIPYSMLTGTPTIPSTVGLLPNTTSLTINGVTQSFTSTPTFTIAPTLQDVTDNNPHLNGAIYSPDNNTSISVGDGNLGLNTDGFLNLDGNIVKINGVQAATINDLPTITSGTNITVSGTAPNYTVSAITPTLTVVNGTLSGSYPTQTLTIPTSSTTIIAGSNVTTTVSGTTYTIAAKPSNYVTPEMYGAIGDGSTDDATAIQNAVNSGSLVLFGAKNYRVNSSITLNGNITIIGSGSLTTISSVSNTPVFNLTGNNNIIQDLQMLGNSAGTSQIGVQILGAASLSVSILNNKISNCIFTNLYTGVSTTSVVGSSSGAKHEGSLTLLNNTFFGNNYGFRAGARSEYNITTLNKFEQCSTAVELSGGNNNLFGDYITDCSVGLQFISSSNDTHSNATGVKFNHNTINITGDHSLDFEFNGCQFFAGNIVLNSVGKTTFNGGEIGLSTNTLSINNSPAYFNNVNFSEAVGTYTLVAGNKPIFVNCYRGKNMMITPTVTTTTSFILNNGAVAKGICNFYDNDVLKLAVSDGGDLTFADGVNIVLSSTTGTKLGTATSQKLGFFNATPIVQPTATTDLGSVLSNLGLRASGTAYPITTSGAVTLTGGLRLGYVAKTASYTITTTDYLIDCTANTFTVTLPTAASVAGKIYEITNSGAGTITLATTSSQTFTNVSGTPTTLTIAATLAKSVRVMSNGTNWLQLN